MNDDDVLSCISMAHVKDRLNRVKEYKYEKEGYKYRTTQKQSVIKRSKFTLIE